jgi:pyrimidine-nucleoside phosphorylase
VSSPLSVLDCIRTKRDGGELDADSLRALILAYTAGEVADYQMSAFLMAAFINGMSDHETDTMVQTMLRSGDVLDLSEIPGAKVDKHSTGGVGDKISLILAPLASVLGVRVPMISGRGLGHSGGTLDKLESIPGLRTDLSTQEFRSQLAALGVAMIGQTPQIAPADRLLYALRDVTATVEFVPFIAASIMSKKLAEGLDGLVLDVKVGNGAFMKTEQQARLLAETLANVGNRQGCRTIALMTSMNEPLGRAIGNWVEVAESMDVLRFKGPPDVTNLSCILAGEMLALSGGAESAEEGAEEARGALRDGRALARFVEMVQAQGGDSSILEDPWSRNGSEARASVRAVSDGYVTAIRAFELGMASVRMGAGRMQKEDDVDPFAGITLNKKVGDPVRGGETLAWLHGSDLERIMSLVPMIGGAFEIGPSRGVPDALVCGRYVDGEWSGLDGA